MFRRIAYALVVLFCLANALAYVAVSAYTPRTVLANATYDDGLFITLGQNLAHTGWFGPFSQFTLMKGPGYPWFLAANAWSGLPISVTQALLHCVAVGLLAWVIARLATSVWLGIAVYLVTLWQPVAFSTDLLRIRREAIYSEQVMLFLAAMLYVLFVTRSARTQWVMSANAGLLFAWLWLTREEGIWLLPGLLVLCIWAVMRQRRVSSRAAVLAILPIVLAATAFAVALLSFPSMNAMVYGRFVGLDINAPDFRGAVAAMQSVQYGDRVPLVPVSRSVRHRLYEVSPTFATLRAYLDPPGGAPWQEQMCFFNPTTCDDIGGGWFIWALRDAAAANGHFRTPTAAAEFFSAMDGEIRNACRVGTLECSRFELGLMPRLAPAQLAALPAAMWSGMLLIANRTPLPERIRPSHPWKFADARGFLNEPIVAPPVDASDTLTFRGWYYRQGDAWLAFEAIRDGGDPVALTLQRVASPDIAAEFDDRDASHQRFEGTIACGLACALVVTSGNGATRRIDNPAKMIAQEQTFPLGGGSLHFDWVSVAHPSAEGGYAQTAAQAVRTLSFVVYRVAQPLLLVIGIAAFVRAAYLALRRGSVGAALVVAVFALLSTVALLVLVAVIHVSSFPAITARYLAPAFYLSDIAALLSLWAAGFFGGKPVGRYD